MATIFDALKGLNQGHEIALNFDNTAGLRNLTSLVGTDGANFLPVDDRGLYLAGVLVPLPTGGSYYEGFPMVQFVHPILTDGQLETWLTYEGMVTIKHHITNSVGVLSVQTSNAYLNFNRNQFSGLTRRKDGWERVVSDFTIVEVIS